MALKWTSKALSDLARPYEFLSSVNKPAAARDMQALSKAPTILLTNPRIGEQPLKISTRQGVDLKWTRVYREPTCARVIPAVRFHGWSRASW